MSMILQHSPTGEPVYQFMDKKHTEGKRIYYATLKQYPDSLEA